MRPHDTEARATTGDAPRASAYGAEDPRRYLRYDETRPARAGINHLRRNLEALLREAHLLGRRAVLPALNLAPQHNFGVERQWRWDTYFDLDRSSLVDTAGTVHALPLVAKPPPAGCPALVLAPGVPAPESAAGQPLVVRQVTNPVFGKEIPCARYGPPDIRFRPAPRVLELATHVVARLRDRGGGEFSAVHVRRRDRLFGPMRWLTGPARVRARLQAVGVPDGAVVYLLSDERAAGFWAPLASRYDLARWEDFPELGGIVSRTAPGGPDNYLLYEVEKQVMREASRRIETFPGTDYEPSHATLVPPAVWMLARLARRSKNAAGEGFRRTVRLAVRGVAGPRGLEAVRRVAARFPRGGRGPE